MDQNENVNMLTDRLVELFNKTHVKFEDTVDLMCSDDYKERFVGEYYQLKIRYDNLLTMITKIEANTLGYTVNTPLNTLKDQLNHMYEYMKLMRLRSELEDIPLTPPVLISQEETSVELKDENIVETGSSTSDDKNKEEVTNE